MYQVSWKKDQAVIQFNNKTAFFSALFMNIFFVFVQLIILVYSFYMGENMGELISNRISGSHFYLQQMSLFVINTLMLYIFFRIEFRIIKPYPNNRRRAWLSFIALFLFMAILSTAVSQLSGIWLKGELTAYQYSIVQFIKDMMLFFSSILITSLIYLIIKNQKGLEENKNLTIENIRNRYNALKNQTDPHFLFNSLNSLSGLIGYDDERAHEYVMQLSSVFRYTIQERSVVTLSEELEFAESYIYLMKIRYGDALFVDIRIPGDHPEYHILPFAIQTLVENAVKHNIASRQKPLVLVVRMTESETIIVENNLQKRQDVRPGNGLGLSNLNERYWLMFRENIKIQADDEVFKVEIPLIKNLDKYNDKFID